MSDYPMLISNKLHSFRNFREQRYERTGRMSKFIFALCRGGVPKMKSKVRKISVSPNPGEPNENGDTLRSNSICHRIVCGVYTCCILKIIFYD